MAMPEIPHHPHSVTLSLSPAEQWTLHHVLLDRIEQEAIATEPSETTPPPVEIFTAFETLNAGGTSFSIAQLEAIQPILAEYHHSPTWEFDRARIEQLLQHVTEQIDQHQPALSTD
jgi:hypothetical protein